MTNVALVYADRQRPDVSLDDVAQALFPNTTVTTVEWPRPATHPAFELLSLQRWLSEQRISIVVVLQERNQLSGEPSFEKIDLFADQVRLALLVMDVATVAPVEQVIVVGADALNRGTAGPAAAPAPDGELDGLLQYFSEKFVGYYGAATEKASVLRWTGQDVLTSKGTSA